MSPEPRIVYSFAKNSREEVRASLDEWGGHQLAHLRVWVDGPDDQPQPTKKGLSVRVEQLPELRRAVEKLIAASEESEV